MYLPAAFRVDNAPGGADDFAGDFATARAMTSAVGFGHLVALSSSDRAPELAFESTPLPFLVRDPQTDSTAAHTTNAPAIWSIVGHVARANPMVRCAGPALMIVPGPDTYISPSWYPSKAVDGKVVPTWSYEVVHLHGQLVIHDDADWLRTLVDELTQQHEAPMPTPWSVDDAPDDYLAQMLRGIVGVELVVERVEAKRKLSQNRTDADRDAVVAALATSPHPGADKVRAAMLQNQGG